MSNTVLKIFKHQYVKDVFVVCTNTPSNSAIGKYKLGKYEISEFILPVSRNYTTKVTQCPDHFYFFSGQAGPWQIVENYFPPAKACGYQKTQLKA
jgi:hypothetical protein